MAAAADLPRGLGIGWRPEISRVVRDVADLGFTEVIAEGLAPAALPRGVAELRERGVAVVPHGVRLSLGGTEPLDPARVTHLAACAEGVRAPLVSEHVAFVRAGGREVGHLLPVPRTREALDVLVRNVTRTQAELDVPLALEPIATLLDWPDDEFPEGEFLTRLLDRTGALLLLDVANVYANARNRGQDPEAVLDTLPLDRIAYVHVAGGVVRDGHYHDSHTAPVPAEVLALLGALTDRLDTPPAVMLERDGDYPPAADLHAELATLRPATVPPSSPIHAAGSPSGTAGRAPGPRESGRSRPRVGAQVPADRPSGELAARQTALVGALVAGGPLPTGFDPATTAATARALLRKRAGEAAKAWPLLAASLGDTWSSTFAAHHNGHEPTGPIRDGWDLARALHDRAELPPAAADELAGRERALRYDGRSAPRVRIVNRLLNRLRRRGRTSRGDVRRSIYTPR